MPDLPTPQDAAEAALFSECWDAVLSYADLCTAGSLAANQLAAEAFALGIGEVRATQRTSARGTGRRPARMPVIPLLLTAVRATATAWEKGGLGHKLDPELRLWLNSDKAARYTGPPLERPVALRGLRDMQEADATLLWLADVEALPPTTVARRLGLDPATLAQELDQVRGLFRDRCGRAHRDTPLDAECRSYARLLDVVTRSAAADTPDDLSRHLATCVRCAETAACLRLHGGGLPAALAGGVIGWGGLAYLERRRRATEARQAGARPETAPAPEAREPQDGRGRTRVARNSLLAAAVLLSVLALGVSMMPFGSDTDDAAHDDRQPVADPSPSLPSVNGHPSVSFSTSASPSTRPPATATASRPPHKKPAPTHRATSTPSAAHRSHPAAPATAAAPTCRVDYEVVDEWSDGFQATVDITTSRALADWALVWTYRDGQGITQMWDARADQYGSRVTVTPRDYDKSVSAGGTISFGFIGSKRYRNSTPDAFSLNGASCAAG
ncbi:cellulose-binding domain-containing protein [Streptomyces sp. NPDC046805]|uniref:cellulose-binding domain-containing protein n=1 Tax=Streptomyces sp. NPDC046805 TaxID=3155134 RepID=UPI0033FD8BE5